MILFMCHIILSITSQKSMKSLDQGRTVGGDTVVGHIGSGPEDREKDATQDGIRQE